MDSFRTVIPKKLAYLGLLTLFTAIIIFHSLVVVQVIPYKIVWGGRLSNDRQMIQFETISIALNLLMLVLVASYSGYLQWGIKRSWMYTGLWMMVALFSLNTIGNMMAVNEWERWIFTPITFFMAIFSVRLAIEK